jgi:hypothetical protein
VRLDPRKGSVSVVEFPHGFGGVVEQATGLRLVLLEDVIYFAGLYGGEGALIVAFEEIERGRWTVGLEIALG